VARLDAASLGSEQPGPTRGDERVAVNKLYLGDNLVVLRHDIPDESVDLVYLQMNNRDNRGQS